MSIFFTFYHYTMAMWWSHELQIDTFSHLIKPLKEKLKILSEKCRDLESYVHRRDLLRKLANTRAKKNILLSFRIFLPGCETFATVGVFRIFNIAIYKFFVCTYMKDFTIIYFFSARESESTKKTHSDLISLPAMIQFCCFQGSDAIK